MPRPRTSEEAPARSGRADKVAARRKDAMKKGRSRPNHSGRPKERRGPKRASGRGAAPTPLRWLKLAGLLFMMGLAGFLIVFVLDTAFHWVAKLDVGGQPMSAIVDKVFDRFLDRDVPRKPPEVNADQRKAPRKTAAPVKPRGAAGSAAASPARAELPAPRPDTYADESAPGREAMAQDPKVDEAKARLDEILRRHGLSSN